MNILNKENAYTVLILGLMLLGVTAFVAGIVTWLFLGMQSLGGVFLLVSSVSLLTSGSLGHRVAHEENPRK